MITKARIKDDLKPAELDWVTALRDSAIKALMTEGAIQPTLLDETDMAEITSPDYPGEPAATVPPPPGHAAQITKRPLAPATHEAAPTRTFRAPRDVPTGTYG